MLWVLKRMRLNETVLSSTPKHMLKTMGKKILYIFMLKIFVLSKPVLISVLLSYMKWHKCSAGHLSDAELQCYKINGSNVAWAIMKYTWIFNSSCAQVGIFFILKSLSIYVFEISIASSVDQDQSPSNGAVWSRLKLIAFKLKQKNAAGVIVAVFWAGSY